MEDAVRKIDFEDSAVMPVDTPMKGESPFKKKPNLNLSAFKEMSINSN